MVEGFTPNQYRRPLRWRLRRMVGTAARLAHLLTTRDVFFDPATCADRRILVVGAAAGVDDELALVDPDGFDIVVRINRGIAQADADPGRFGRRTNILFHNLKEQGPRGAGALSPDLLARQGTGLVVCPHADLLVLPDSFGDMLLAKRDLGGARLRLARMALYRRTVRALGYHMPTTGTMAILSMLETRFAALHLVGFTFYTTGYHADYNPQAASAEAAQVWVGALSRHDPAAEARLVAARIATVRADGRTVTMGPATRQALARM